MKLTDKYISNLKHLDKDQFFSQEGVEGLTLRVYKYPSKAKTWFYQYRPKGKSSVRIKIGSHYDLGINKAISRAKKLSNDIFVGKDPHEIRQGFKGELTLGEQLQDSYKSILTSTRYSESTIATIKNIFGTYIFRKTKNPKIREVFSQLDNIKHIKVSSITPTFLLKKGIVSTTESNMTLSPKLGSNKLVFT